MPARIAVALSIAATVGATGEFRVASAKAANASPRRSISATFIRRRLEAGKPVSMTGGTVRGTLLFPPHVSAPLTLHGVKLLGPLDATSTTFDRLIDLRGSTLNKGADFSGATFEGPLVLTQAQVNGPLRFAFATFRGSALFAGARLNGAVTFFDAEFDRESVFRGVQIRGPTEFDSSWFGDSVSFASSDLSQRASFDATEFRAAADFSSAQFGGAVLFRGARFADVADFIGTVFGSASEAPASFQYARFQSGAGFLDAEFDGQVHFELAQSAGDMSFDGAEFDGPISFSTAQLLGSETFSQATLYASANFDQAALHRLDLDGAIFANPGVTVSLPKPGGTIGRIDELRFDPADAGHFGIGHGRQSDAEEEHALSLAEAAALRGGDAKAANQADLERRALIRGDEFFALRALDWAFGWGVTGYLVQPWHQVGTVATLLVLFALVRVLWAKPSVGFLTGLKQSWGALWRPAARQGSFWHQAEAQTYNLVLILFLLNLANVWPLGHDLVKGLLP